MQHQPPFNCQPRAVPPHKANEATKTTREKETSQTKEKLKDAAILNPLANFCASLFYPNREEQQKGCDE